MMNYIRRNNYDMNTKFCGRTWSSCEDDDGLGCEYVSSTGDRLYLIKLPEFHSDLNERVHFQEPQLAGITDVYEFFRLVEADQDLLEKFKRHLNALALEQ
jgi:hypothetical protein